MRVTWEEFRAAFDAGDTAALQPHCELDLSHLEVVAHREGPYWEALEEFMSLLMDHPRDARIPESIDVVIPGGTPVEYWRRDGAATRRKLGQPDQGPARRS